MPVFRQFVMPGGHHRLPESFGSLWLHGLWAVRQHLKEKTFGLNSLRQRHDVVSEKPELYIKKSDSSEKTKGGLT
jgi:hypothetical protein